MPDYPTIQEKILELRRRKSQAYLAAGEKKIAERHAKGLLTARERIEALLDPGSFCEQYLFAETISQDFGMDRNRYPGDGAIVGFGKIHGRLVCVAANDSLVMGGSAGSSHVRKLTQTIDLAIRLNCPFIQLNDFSGGRVQEGTNKTSFSGSIFYSHTQASGVVPQITAIMGRCAGGAVYGAALTDFTFIVDNLGEMFVTGPSVLLDTTGEKINYSDLGGARVCTQISGIADFLMANEKECLEQIRRLLDFIPSSCNEFPNEKQTIDSLERFVPELEEIVPSSPERVYDMRKVIKRILDKEDFMEVKADFAKNIIVGLGRMGGQSVGIVANQPMFLGGSLTVDSSEKSARFIRFCDAFNIPLLFFVDTPGYLPGVKQEHAGIIRHGAKLLYAFCESTVPKVAVVIRKSYGGGHFAMGGHKEHGTDFVFAWPNAEFAIMGAKQAARFLYKRELEKASDPNVFLQEKIKEYREIFASPYNQARTMCVDDIIEPKETRIKIIQAFNALKNKREKRLPRKHGNIPL